MTARQLRDDQAKLIADLRATMKDGYMRPLVQAPGGYGKTFVLSEMTKRARDRRKQVLVTVPRVDLIDKTWAEFAMDGITGMGVMQSDHPKSNPLAAIQIASVQTLEARRDKMPDFGLMLVDEAHIRYRIISEIIRNPAYERIPIIGFSATPWSKGLGDDYNALVVAMSSKEAIERGILVPFKVFAPFVPDMTGVKEGIDGDYATAAASAKVSGPKVVGDIVDNWIKHGEGKPTLCFANDRAHGEEIFRQFQDKRIQCAYVDGETDRDSRKFIRDEFEGGHYKVLVNIDVFSTGTDMPWIECVIDAAPTKSEQRYVQRWMRGSRLSPGKTCTTVFDHTGNAVRMGFVEEIHHATLHSNVAGAPRSGEDRVSADRLPKVCPSCKMLKQPGVRECPNCKFVPTLQSAIQTVAGELVELGPGAKPKGQPRPRAPVVTRELKQRWYSMLLWVAREKGYAKGWVGHKYKEKFSVFPVGLDCVSIAPDMIVTSWLRARAIARHKGNSKRLVDA